MGTGSQWLDLVRKYFARRRDTVATGPVDG
jgi:hypothetical protein